MGMPANPRQVLTIAGSDSGAGAGIEADLKSIHANGGYGLVVLTSVTAQNTKEVASSFDLPLEIIRAQIAAVFDDFDVAAAKTGMLSSAEITGVVAEELSHRGVRQLVVDPAIISTSGFPLLDESAVDVVRKRLLPLARVCTPNRLEAEVLSGMKISGLEDAQAAARKIQDLGARAVVVKGGHMDAARATDLLMDGDEVHLYDSEWIDTRSTHGTGCTLSAAVATWLARGVELPEAVSRAKRFITLAIRHGLKIGHGHPPTDPFFFLKARDWTAFTGG